MEQGAVTSLLLEAGSLMLIGMLFVFAFLGLLIIGVQLITKFCDAFDGDAAQSPPMTRPKATQPGVDGNVVAAITAAVHTHRKANKK
jgi:oxaloacetate decarboxylase gamma subunit